MLIFRMIKCNDIKLKGRYKYLSNVSQNLRGMVFKIEDTLTNNEIKILKQLNPVVSNSENKETLRYEAENLMELNNDFVIKYLDIFYSKLDFFDIYYYVFPFYKDGTLKDILEACRTDRNYLKVHVMNWSTNILKGLKYLHDNSIIHQNIKPDCNNQLIIGNIFCYNSRNTNIRINQFRKVNYLAPEIINEESHIDFKIDIWSFGCVFYEMLKLKPLFQGKNNLENILMISNFIDGDDIFSDISNIYSNIYYDILSRTVVKDSNCRLDTSELINILTGTSYNITKQGSTENIISYIKKLNYNNHYINAYTKNIYLLDSTKVKPHIHIKGLLKLCIICSVEFSKTNRFDICTTCFSYLRNKTALLQTILEKKFTFNCITIHNSDICLNNNFQIENLQNIEIKKHNIKCVKCKLIYMHLFGLFEFKIPKEIYVYVTYPNKATSCITLQSIFINNSNKNEISYYNHKFNYLLNLNSDHIFKYLIFDIDNGPVIKKVSALYLFIIFITGVRSEGLMYLKIENCKLIKNVFYFSFFCKKNDYVEKSILVNNLVMQKLISDILSYGNIYFFELICLNSDFKANYAKNVYSGLTFRLLRIHFCTRELYFLYQSLINFNQEENFINLIQKAFKKNPFKAFFLLLMPVRKLLNHNTILSFHKYEFIIENHYLDPRILYKILRLYLNEKISREILILILINSFLKLDNKITNKIKSSKKIDELKSDITHQIGENILYDLEDVYEEDDDLNEFIDLDTVENKDSSTIKELLLTKYKTRINTFDKIYTEWFLNDESLSNYILNLNKEFLEYSYIYNTTSYVKSIAIEIEKWLNEI